MFRHAFLLLASLGLASAAPLAAQARFEGAISMRLNDKDGRTQVINYEMKNNRFRFEAPGRGGQSAAIVIDPEGKRMLIMMSAQQMYMERPMDIPVVTPPSGGTVASRATITRTGKKETIAGRECEHVLVTDADGAQVDACMARGLGSFFRPPSGNPMAGGSGSDANEWQSKVGADGFPLKVTKGGTVVLEVTSIEKKSLDDSLFDAPAGWRKLDLSNMGGMRRP